MALERALIEQEMRSKIKGRLAVMTGPMRLA
jgi:hypothetical protein